MKSGIFNVLRLIENSRISVEQEKNSLEKKKASSRQIPETIVRRFCSWIVCVYMK